MERPLLVTDFLDRARKYYGDETAVVATTGDRYTYGELGERADRFSAVLQRPASTQVTTSRSSTQTRTTTSKRPTAGCRLARFTRP